MISGVYMIRCVKTGHCYIGSSRNIKKRWERHRNECTNNNHHNSWLQRAWVKYGAGAFEFLVLEECGENRVEREQHHMDACGKNLKNASKLAHCAETTPKKRRQSSITAKRLHKEGRWGYKSWRPGTAEKVALIASQTHKGRKRPPSTVAKLQKLQARLWKDPEHRKAHKAACAKFAKNHWTPERRLAQAERLRQINQRSSRCGT